jgi:hypothetical protein
MSLGKFSEAIFEERHRSTERFSLFCAIVRPEIFKPIMTFVREPMPWRYLEATGS